MARHRRPVNVRDDGLPAVLGPLVTVGGLDLAILLDVDSGMVLDAWARGDGAAQAQAIPDDAAWLGFAQAEDGYGRTDSCGAAGDDAGRLGGARATGGVGDGVAGAEPRAGRAVAFGGAGAVVAGAAVGVGINGNRSDGRGPARGDRPDAPVAAHQAVPRNRLSWAIAGRRGAAPGIDPETLGALHADVVRALLALAGSPPGELSLVVDGRHHLVRCVADPAGGRLALAVVVTGSQWVVRRVRRHLRQLPDAGLTTGPWILSWAVGPAPRPTPRVPPPMATGPGAARFAAVDDGGPPTSDGRPKAHAEGGLDPESGGGHPPATVREVRSGPGGSDAGIGAVRAAGSGSGSDDRCGAAITTAAAPGDPPDAESRSGPTSRFVPDGDGTRADARTDPMPSTGSAAVGPDLRRGPAPPSALPPARTGGGR